MRSRQFSLRAIFALTTAIAVLSSLAVNLGRLSERAAFVAPSGSVWLFIVAGGIVGATVGRLVGTDWIDAALGSSLGAGAAVMVELALPTVQ